MSNESEAEDEQTQADDEPEIEEEAAEDEQTSGLQDDDFVRLEYTARTIEDGQLVDTTSQEVAEEEGIDDDEREFGPRTIVLGQGHIFASVEDDIRGEEVGTEGTVTVPAGEAFGEFEEDQVRTISKDKIPEDDRYPGAQVTVDGDDGFVETIVGGRARVDFNHPLAGDDIEYDYEIADTVDDRMEMAEGLVDMYLGLDLEMWFETETVEEEQLVEDEDEEAEDDEESEPEYETVEVEKESLYIEATPQLTMNQQWMMQKQQIGQELIDLLGIDRIIVQETIEDSPMGMPGMMGGMGGAGGADLEEALEDADIDADDLAEELE
ncbi:FKBP-type peptidyl-prolyl cis-trans isomerase SlyD [Halovenus aranensis]|jgi:FKBP-type peptidyl-prolyl cis-trans isomerase SlyD|uniref:peptidylprolyl isomerase n=1 Tax=Halovenus aranensis TaxID=890420 RepID=A0A1G8S757_9EURY|nr:peptidylprolyl isomerase [Halovenus aranensis]SDJ25013.1 FKBP-type peptidyl-prolyl cis-trans isomerase SlyD [Halovenus aranensis]